MPWHDDMHQLQGELLDTQQRTLWYSRTRFLWTWIALSLLAMLIGFGAFTVTHIQANVNTNAKRIALGNRLASLTANNTAVKAQETSDKNTETNKRVVSFLKGERGLSGVPGSNGTPGTPGKPGLRGGNGPQGAKGDKGDPGATGQAGQPGATGSRGDTGSSGSSGSTGETGPKGDSGSSGKDGATGSQGAIGVEGIAGVAGPPGPAGPAGPSGADGAAGAAGAAGGTGPPGPSACPDGSPLTQVTVTDSTGTPTTMLVCVIAVVAP